MLTKADDYPIHQTPEPIAFAGTDRNFYDRYFFNGYARDGEVFFAVAMGIYPHLNVIDAAFSVIRAGRQHNVRASRCLSMERMDTRAGAISVEVVEPLRKLRVRVDDREHGIRAELLFAGRARPIEEPRYTRRIGPRTFFDLTRMTQNGGYDGWIEVDGERIEVRPERFLGTRDRSWGVRPIGAADAQPHAPASATQFYWLWAPLNFDDGVFLYDVNQDAAGDSWHQSAFLGALGEIDAEAMASASSSVVFKPGTRHARSATLHLRRRRRQRNRRHARAVLPILDVRHRVLPSRMGPRQLHRRGSYRVRRLRARHRGRDVAAPLARASLRACDAA